MVAVANNIDTIIEPTCRICHRTFTIFVNRDDLVDWMSGQGFIQDILYYLTDGERELLISNTCNLCFDKLFPPLDSESDE